MRKLASSIITACLFALFLTAACSTSDDAAGDGDGDGDGDLLGDGDGDLPGDGDGDLPGDGDGDLPGDGDGDGDGDLPGDGDGDLPGDGDGDLPGDGDGDLPGDGDGDMAQGGMSGVVQPQCQKDEDCLLAANFDYTCNGICTAPPVANQAELDAEYCLFAWDGNQPPPLETSCQVNPWGCDSYPGTCTSPASCTLSYCDGGRCVAQASWNPEDCPLSR